MRISIFVICSRLGAAGSRLRLLSSQTSGCTMRRQEHNGKYKAVIFDMGGVLVPGPGSVFRGKLSHIINLLMMLLLEFYLLLVLHLPVLLLGWPCIRFSLF